MGKNGPMGIMPYYTVPDDVFEDEDVFLEWASRSRDAAVRRRAAKTEKEGKKRSRARPTQKV